MVKARNAEPKPEAPETEADRTKAVVRKTVDAMFSPGELEAFNNIDMD